MNAQLESSSLHILQQQLGYHFKDEATLWQSLTHRSYGHEYLQHLKPSERDNERFEFLGDAILDAIISDLLLELYPHVNEGQLSKMRAAVVNEKTLAEVALQIHLSSLVRLGKGESRTGGAKKHSIVSSTLEAMIAAVYLDGGFLEAYQVVQRLFKSFLNEHMSSKTSLDYKTSLQELIQAQYKMTPTYHLLGTDGPDHERLFSVEVRMGQTILAQAQGSSKKEAEQNAAKIAIDQTTSTGIALGSV